MSTGPKYPNQQLRSVSIETFFPGRFAALVRADSIQSSVGKRLPNLFVPHAKEGEALALQPYQLRDNKQTRSLAVAANQVSYVAFDTYPGYPSFKGEALPLLSETLAICEVDTLSRVSYRYENEVFLQRTEFGMPVDQILDLTQLPPWMPQKFHELRLAWSEQRKPMVLAFELAIEGDAGQPYGTLRFSIRALLDQPSLVADLDSTVDAVHDLALDAFEKMICEQFREHIMSPGDENDE